MNGIEAIPEKWKVPIGNKIITACLNLGERGVYGSQLPGNIENLTDRVYKITQQVILRNNLQIEISAYNETDLSDLKVEKLYCSKGFMSKFNKVIEFMLLTEKVTKPVNRFVWS